MMRMIFVHISRVVHGALCVRERASRRPCVPRRWRQCSGRAFARAKRAFVTTEARRDGGDDDVDGGCAMQCVSHSSFVIRHSFARVVNVVGVVVNVPNAVGLPRETTGRDDEDFLIFLETRLSIGRIESFRFNVIHMTDASFIGVHRVFVGFYRFDVRPIITS